MGRVTYVESYLFQLPVPGKGPTTQLCEVVLKGIFFLECRRVAKCELNGGNGGVTVFCQVISERPTPTDRDDSTSSALLEREREFAAEPRVLRNYPNPY